ncbi:hypothetical protein K438DRAFT_2024913 [Mycena galopus ATCC 62051]|nr:hypothetical protein K438DRAFT_2024913 [Mycena galopus ATCC 62051]
MPPDTHIYHPRQRANCQNQTELLGKVVTLDHPWANGTSSTPFDQDFYLMMNVAVGSANGWFPYGQGNKPWLNEAGTARNVHTMTRSLTVTGDCASPLSKAHIPFERSVFTPLPYIIFSPFTTFERSPTLAPADPMSDLFLISTHFLFRCRSEGVARVEFVSSFDGDGNFPLPGLRLDMEALRDSSLEMLAYREHSTSSVAQHPTNASELRVSVSGAARCLGSPDRLSTSDDVTQLQTDSIAPTANFSFGSTKSSRGRLSAGVHVPAVDMNEQHQQRRY